MARLHRLAHEVVWLNPLREDPAYDGSPPGAWRPLSFVDVFTSGHNLASLEELAAELARL